jgi:hypothetical protein
VEEVRVLREEATVAQSRSLQLLRDCEQLRDAMMRQGHDIDRLIEEKRELEDLVD